MATGLKKIIGLSLVGLLAATNVQAADLMQAFHDALQNDQTFKQAQSQLLSDKEQIPQAFALLHPSITGSGRSTRQVDYFDQGFINALTTGGTGSTESNKLYSYRHDYAIDIVQPLINVQSWRNLWRASDLVKADKAKFRAAYLDLIIRVSQAYFNVLEAQDNLTFTQSEKRANARQLEQAQQRFKVGLDAITSVYDAQSRYDSTVADEIAAKNDVRNSKQSLREITGHLYKKLAVLKKQVPLLRPVPNDVTTWVAMAREHNFDITDAHYQAEAADKTIGVNAAANYPVVNLFTEYRDVSANRSSVNIVNNVETGTIGAELNFPMFQGGLTISRTRQARYDYQTALSSLEGVLRNVDVQTRQAFNNIITNISKIKADRQTVISTKSTVVSREAAFRVGTRTIIDVLDAQRDLFQAQSVYARDQYAYINDRLQLKQLAGNLTAEDLAEINGWLHYGTPGHFITPKTGLEDLNPTAAAHGNIGGKKSKAQIAAEKKLNEETKRLEKQIKAEQAAEDKAKKDLKKSAENKNAKPDANKQQDKSKQPNSEHHK